MAGTVIADNLQAASTSQLVIKNGVANTPPTIQDSGGTEVGTFCRAWVNFNGTGTVAINASFNVSSITDHAVGKYTVNFTNAMPDANYSVGGTALHTDGTGFAMTVSLTSLATPATGSCRISVAVPTIGFADPSVVTVSVFR